MKTLRLSKGMETALDDEDFNKASQFNWHASKTRGGIVYVQGRAGSRKKVYLHRWILDADKGTTIDHIDGNPLNNCRNNLRFCSQSENLQNRRKQKNCSSKFKGVYFIKRLSKWGAQIKLDKITPLGTFSSEKEAALTYNVAASFAFKEFAKLNTL